MDIEKECIERFEDFIDAYYEGFQKTLTKEYLRDQFKHFNDAPGKFIYPYLYDVYSYPERKFPDEFEDGQPNGEPMEDWQRKTIEAYVKEKMSEMTKNFTDYMMHILVLKTYLNALGVNDE